jgi:hypothetical protein
MNFQARVMASSYSLRDEQRTSSCIARKASLENDAKRIQPY